jgi:hypothetical protein
METATTTLEAGERVQIVIAEDHPLNSTTWFPRGEVFGIVQKVFKNGKVAVAVEGVRNQSADGLLTMHFESPEIVA